MTDDLAPDHLSNHFRKENVMSHAYLVMLLDTRKNTVGFGVFSEEKPTMLGSVIMGTVVTGDGKTYDEARVHLGRVIDVMPWGQFVRDRLDRPLPTTPAIEAMKQATDGS
jgi:hypothetical protein